MTLTMKAQCLSPHGWEVGTPLMVPLAVVAPFQSAQMYFVSVCLSSPILDRVPPEWSHLTYLHLLSTYFFAVSILVFVTGSPVLSPWIPVCIKR